MGESCEEGGPCPSHKIPRNVEARSKTQNIALFICQKYPVTIKVQLAFPHKNSRVSIPLFQCRYPLYRGNIDYNSTCSFTHLLR